MLGQEKFHRTGGKMDRCFDECNVEGFVIVAEDFFFAEFITF